MTATICGRFYGLSDNIFFKSWFIQEYEPGTCEFIALPRALIGKLATTIWRCVLMCIYSLGVVALSLVWT